MELNQEDQLKVADLKNLQNQVRQEMEHRDITGRPFNFQEMSYGDLAEYDRWYSSRIDNILLPYESDES